MKSLLIFGAFLVVLSGQGAVGASAQEGQELAGASAPEWELVEWFNSEPLSLERLKGRVVLARWWTGPECPYCAASAPYLVRWDEKYRRRGLVVVGIYHHKSPVPLTRAYVAQLVDRYGFRFPVAVDPDWRTLQRWWLEEHPRSWTSVSFLIDKNGVIRYVHPGGAYTDEDARAMESRIEELLAAPPAFSHDLYDRVLNEYVAEGRVDYARLKDHRAELDRYVASLGDLDPNDDAPWDEAARIAFWINAYNAITLKVVVDHYPIRRSPRPAALVFPANSIRQIPGAWDRITHTVMGRPMTLDQIEHKVLRTQFREPRIHLALVCAAKGCPPLRSEAYRGERLNEQLEDQAARFLADPAKFQIDRAHRIVRLSPIFQWFGEDFLKASGPLEGFSGHPDTERAVLAFISRRLPPEDQAFLRRGSYRVAYLSYDWTLNE